MELNYLPIRTPTTQQTFSDYVDSLDIPQIDYFAIGVQNKLTQKSISLMSLPEWQQQFVANQYADYDPLRKVALTTKRNIIPLDEIDFTGSFGKEIMRQRALMGIKNGLVLMQRFPKYNYILTLGTGFSRFDTFEFIKRYHDKISLIKNDLIQLIEKEVKAFIPTPLRTSSSYLSNDAK